MHNTISRLLARDRDGTGAKTVFALGEGGSKDKRGKLIPFKGEGVSLN